MLKHRYQMTSDIENSHLEIHMKEKIQISLPHLMT